MNGKQVLAPGIYSWDVECAQVSRMLPVVDQYPTYVCLKSHAFKSLLLASVSIRKVWPMEVMPHTRQIFGNIISPLTLSLSPQDEKKSPFVLVS